MRTKYISAVLAGAVAVASVLATAPAMAQMKPASLAIKTGTSGSTFFVTGAGLAKLFSDHGVKTSTELGGGNANIVSLDDKKVDVGLAQAVALNMAAQGQAPFPRKINSVRGLAALWTSAVHLIVSKESGVTNVAQLKGKRFFSQPKAATAVQMVDMILQVHGMPGGEADLNIIGRGGFGHGAAALKDRRVIGFQTASGYPSGAVSEVAASLPVTFLTIGEDKFKMLQKKNSGFVRSAIPAGTYKGQDKEIPTVGSSANLICRSDTPNDTAYWIMKTIVDNIDDFRAIHAIFKTQNPKRLAAVVGVELHPGAARYYKEIGALK